MGGEYTRNCDIFTSSNKYQRVEDRAVRGVGYVPSSLNKYFAENRPVFPKVFFKI